MANVVARVPDATTPWGDSKIWRVPAATAAIYYPGAMIALNSVGNAVKCDNTAGLRFDGINVSTARIQVFGTETLAELGQDTSRQILVDRPWRFTAKIAAAVAGDEGKALYALYDDEVSYSQSASIFVGWVDQILSSTLVLVRPAWSGQAVGGVVGFDGGTLTFTGTTGANTIVMPDALADALTIKEGSTAYLTFVTSNGTEAVNLFKQTTITSTSATAFQVGPNGATNPTLLVVGSVSSEAGGLKVTGAADAVGVALAAIGSNTNEPLKLDAKGSGVISIGTVSTGGAKVRVPVSTQAATGTVIGNVGTTLVEGFNYVTAANNALAVQLPVGAVGMQVTVVNAVYTATLPVFPQVNAAINNLTANASYSMGNGSKRVFTFAATNQWYTDLVTIN